MISIGANGDKIAYGIKHYNVDTLLDLSNIDKTHEVMGTTVFVIENSRYYMLNGAKQWKQIDPYGGSSGGGDTPLPDEVIYEGGGVR